MAREIERKFLVTGDGWRAQVSRSMAMVQGYLAGPPAARCSVRLRISDGDAWLTIKSAEAGIERDEYEYAVPCADARRMLESLAGAIVAKRRHYAEIDGDLFEIDEFEGDNAGLVVAEIELDAADAAFARPHWLGREISHLQRYYNLNLATRPYARWSDAERNANDAA